VRTRVRFEIGYKCAPLSQDGLLAVRRCTTSLRLDGSASVSLVRAGSADAAVKRKVGNAQQHLCRLIRDARAEICHLEWLTDRSTNQVPPYAVILPA
jgi:hypothetical protein